jgi:ABC-2 type transport system ATP-binding protein
MADAIVTRDLTKQFPGVRAVDGLDLTVAEGQVFGFLGQNGSGKTTTIRMLTTLLRPTSGSAHVGGLDVERQPALVRSRIGVALQEAGLDDLQTGRELLTLQGHLFRMHTVTVRRRVDELLEVVELQDAADRRIRTYSGGMKRRLDLASALIHEPRLVFLDEPTTGLDPISREALWRYLEVLNREHGVTFFLTTQYLEEADRLAHEVAIIDRGRVVAQGSPAALKSSIGADAVSLDVEGEPAARERARAALAALEGVEQVRDDDGGLMLYVRNGSRRIPAILTAVGDAGLHTHSVRLTEPTLDDVFLQHTGHHLLAGAPVEAPAARGEGE